MFQPSGPNLRRSCKIAWNIESEKRSFLYGAGLVHPSNCSSVMSLYVRFKLALTPLGGSLVSLTPFCSTSTGKVCAGIDVSHSRKSSCTEECGWFISSTSRASDNIHELARWQFCRHTQSPFFCAAATSCSAIGPWPCPRLTICRRSPGIHPFLVAKRWSMEVGSAPVLKTKMTGVRHDVSGKTSSSVHGGASVNFWPILLPTYSWNAAISFSSRKILSTIMR
mmetsp:Transcript_24000/g.78087  ORF Transcript_24000/g.78087 Transcript_24000/m.78087 type:complete len:223 (-) Transcript_24000:3073-3741(-)